MIETIVGKIAEYALASLTRNSARQVPRDLETRLDDHVREVEDWSSHVDLFGLFGQRLTERDTVPLNIALPRKLRLRDDPGETRTESGLLQQPGHYILLGDPGAGKTTTLKRLARYVFTSSGGGSDTVQYPVLVRLREISNTLLLDEQLARLFGLVTERQTLTGTGNSNFKVVIGSELAVDVIKQILEDTSALLLLDGLDEVNPDLRGRTEHTIVDIARHCRAARVVVSCRSGDYHLIEPLQALEIAPLDEQQVRIIAELWSDDPAGFLKSLTSVPFRDLASRPLFLGQLMVLYRNSGSIPSRPVDIYRRIVRLAVDEWDKQNVRRISRYSEFDSETKIDFLAALAHYLTYKLKSKVFNVEELLDAYVRLRERFALPEREGRAVVAEIETHTGIFVEAGYQRFEFSHLSLQEYLCALHLINRPIGIELLQSLKENPAPVAMLVAMSTDSADWLAAIVLHKHIAVGKLATYPLQSFFSRLLQERPIFVPTDELGYAALRIRFDTPENPRDEYTEKFLALPAVRAATAAAMRSYSASRLDSYHLRLTLRHPWQHRTDIGIPSTGVLFENELDRILIGQSTRMVRRPADGDLVTLDDEFEFVEKEEEYFT